MPRPYDGFPGKAADPGCYGCFQLAPVSARQIRSPRRADKKGISGKQMVACLQADTPGRMARGVDDREGDGPYFDGIFILKQNIGWG